MLSEWVTVSDSVAVAVTDVDTPRVLLDVSMEVCELVSRGETVRLLERVPVVAPVVVLDAVAVPLRVALDVRKAVPD